MSFILNLSVNNCFHLMKSTYIDMRTHDNATGTCNRVPMTAAENGNTSISILMHCSNEPYLIMNCDYD